MTEAARRGDVPALQAMLDAHGRTDETNKVSVKEDVAGRGKPIFPV